MTTLPLLNERMSSGKFNHLIACRTFRQTLAFINPLDLIFMEPALAAGALVAVQQVLATFNHEIKKVRHR